MNPNSTPPPATTTTTTTNTTTITATTTTTNNKKNNNIFNFIQIPLYKTQLQSSFHNNIKSDRNAIKQANIAYHKHTSKKTTYYKRVLELNWVFIQKTLYKDIRMHCGS